MRSVVDDLATIPGVQAYLWRHPQFAAHTVERLTGGMGNFVYRLRLHTTFAGRWSLVLKYAPPYAAASGGAFPIDKKRQAIEASALHIASQLLTASDSTFITVPTVHLFDEENHVIIMDDAGEDCRTLKDILIEEGLPKVVAKQIGIALGKFIVGVHAWSQNLDIDLTAFANNEVGKYVSALVTYGRLESTLTGRDNIPALSNPLLGIPEAKMATISKLAEKRKQAINSASVSDPMTHGDLWPGNLVLVPRYGTDGIEGVERLYVLDWELSKTGLRGLDLGQFCAEMCTLSEFHPAREEATRTIIESFLDAYREQMGKGRDVELARIVVSHIGAHMVAFTPRISSWSGRERTREVVEKGVELLVLGEAGTESTLESSIVGPLLQY